MVGGVSVRGLFWAGWGAGMVVTLGLKVKGGCYVPEKRLDRLRGWGRCGKKKESKGGGVGLDRWVLRLVGYGSFAIDACKRLGG